MRTILNYAAMLGVLISVAGVVFAQNQNGAQPAAATNVAIAAGVGASEPYYGYGHQASTAEAGLIEGVGGLVRSRGEASYFNSLMAVNAQEAYSRFLQNAERGKETYFRVKQVNQAAREATRPQRLNYDQHAEMAKRYGPAGLNGQQYDRTLGRLNWPAILNAEEFAAERVALDRLFMVRTPLDAGAGSEFYRNVRRLAESMEAKLKVRLNDVTPGEYLAARKFITGLTVESQQPLVVQAVATR